MDRYEFIASKDYKKLLIENHVEITDATFASLVFHNKFILALNPQKIQQE